MIILKTNILKLVILFILSIIQVKSNLPECDINALNPDIKTFRLTVSYVAESVSGVPYFYYRKVDPDGFYHTIITTELADISNDISTYPFT